MDVSIDQVWSLNEEEPLSRANNWGIEETIALLDLIKTNKLMEGGPSHKHLGQVLEPMLDYTRTPFQITGKLKNLRKSYLRCLRSGCTPAALEECPHYDELVEMYGKSPNLNDSDAITKNETEDIKLCSQRGIELMFDVIQELNLGAGITLQSFSGKAVRSVSEVLMARGICAPVDRVKNILVGLRKSYIDSRRGKNGSLRKFSYYKHLHALWGSMSIPNVVTNCVLAKPKIEPGVDREGMDYWSEEETVALLTSIKALNLTKEAYVNDERAAMKLHLALRDNGYSRSCYHIQRRLENMRTDFQLAQRAKTERDAVRKFPFYHLYEGTFGPAQSNTSAKDIEELTRQNPPKKIRLNEETISEKIKNVRSRAWSEEETILMLDLLVELNLSQLIAHRLSFEVATEMVQPLREQGYARSALQIQIKLRNLRRLYHQCVKDGSTEEAIAECPFYFKLDTIFNTKSDYVERKVSKQLMRKMEEKLARSSNCANVAESYNDHSYFNVASDVNKRQRRIPKLEPNVDEEDYENNTAVWLPVETIVNDYDTKVGIQEEPIFVEDQNGPPEGFEPSDETERYADSEENESNAFGNSEDPLDESTINEDVDDGVENDDADDGIHDDENNDGNIAVEYASEMSERPGASERTLRRSTRLESVAAIKRKRQIETNPYSLRNNKDSPILRSMRIVMAEVLRQEKQLQSQHQVWMERQFELQRKHDRDQRELLLKELREFRKSMLKQQSNGQRP